MNKIYNNLLNNKKPVCVWGTGYIGLSTMAFFSQKNIKACGYDVDKKLVNNLSRGFIKNDDFKKWLGFEIKPYVKKGKLSFKSELSEIEKIDPEVNFVCIPTEKNGKPLMSILQKTIKNIKKVSSSGIIIIESTLTPGTADKIIQKYLIKEIKNKKFLFAIAPRRDWFVDGTKNLTNMDRVFGGINKESSFLCKKILGIVCRKLHMASSHQVAEMVKSFENCYRHVDIALANQLSLAYPKDNIRETLKLVGTKWNIGTFYPGFGSGGYCIPLSSKYVISGSLKKKSLGILQQAIKTDNHINILIANSVIKKKCKKVGILGLSYKSNLKVSTLSPIIPFIKKLKSNKISVKIFDPYFSNKEIKKIANANTFKFPKDLSSFDCIIYSVNHYNFVKNKNKILRNLKCKYFIDNTGEFKNSLNTLKAKKINYILSGEKNWI